ncbi:MAG: hypothetical protein IPK75_01285 [Acidobacteria bacterium]|nr:hypothetical protein [Acidobacteriota bacterium]
MFSNLKTLAASVLAAFSLGNVSGCALLQPVLATANGTPYAEVCDGADGIEGGVACTLTWYQSALSTGKDLCLASGTEPDADLRAAQEATCLKVAAIDGRVTSSAELGWAALAEVSKARALSASDDSAAIKVLEAARQLQEVWALHGPLIAEAVNDLRGE